MKHFYVCLFLVLFLTACGPSAEEQATMTATAMTATAASWTRTPTSTNTATSTPTLTPTPTETSTPTPSETPTRAPTKTAIPPTLTPTLDLPVGTPVAVWQGIPIMPGAIAGEGGEVVYEYITNATQEEVRDYYIETMPLYGWQYLDHFPDGPGKFITILPNDKGGFIIYLGSPFDIIYLYEENGLTFVTIIYNP